MVNKDVIRVLLSLNGTNELFVGKKRKNRLAQNFYINLKYQTTLFSIFPSNVSLAFNAHV